MVEVERKRSPERKQRESPLKGSRRWLILFVFWDIILFKVFRLSKFNLRCTEIQMD
jgi:hypothetical protein